MQINISFSTLFPLIDNKRRALKGIAFCLEQIFPSWDNGISLIIVCSPRCTSNFKEKKIK